MSLSNGQSHMRNRNVVTTTALPVVYTINIVLTKSLASYFAGNMPMMIKIQDCRISYGKQFSL